MELAAVSHPFQNTPTLSTTLTHTHTHTYIQKTNKHTHTHTNRSVFVQLTKAFEVLTVRFLSRDYRWESDSDSVLSMVLLMVLLKRDGLWLENNCPKFTTLGSLLSNYEMRFQQWRIKNIYFFRHWIKNNRFSCSYLGLSLCTSVFKWILLKWSTNNAFNWAQISEAFDQSVSKT